MTAQLPKIIEKAPENLPCDWRPARNNLAPSTRGEAIALLSACLSLVRPVGMSNDEVTDWLAVASSSVDHLPIDLLDAACLDARRTCTHHAQIVPAVIEMAQPRYDERRRLANLPEWSPTTALPPPEPPPPMTQADVDALPAHLRSLGLKMGFLAQDEAGNIVLAPAA